LSFERPGEEQLDTLPPLPLSLKPLETLKLFVVGAGSAAILCTGGPDANRKEAWPFYRTISDVRLCWELEEPNGPKRAHCRRFHRRWSHWRRWSHLSLEPLPLMEALAVTLFTGQAGGYRSTCTSLIGNIGAVFYARGTPAHRARPRDAPSAPRPRSYVGEPYSLP